MTESKLESRKAAVSATRAVPFPDPSQAGVAYAFQAPIYHTGQWLSLPEAAAYTGLPQSTLRKLMASRKLPALDTGPRLGGRWRIKRTDLDGISAP
jgi:excisionase family DNA binding protein